MPTASTDTVYSIDPRTGERIGQVASATTAESVDERVRAAAAAAPELERRGRGFRAGMLRAIADALEARRDDIVRTASDETAIPVERLHGELTRTAYQARLFADVLDEGSYLEAAIDHAGQTPMGPGPDLRRMLVPIGPVAVFGSSNFPLAFSVPGGDTVSALAAGNPVIAKAHSSHPATSQLCFTIMREALDEWGAPAGTLGIVFGQAAGTALVAHDLVRAVGFTGSLATAEKLLAVIDARREPIPFYGELSSLNPVVVTAAAARSRAAEIAEGLFTSITVSGGQLCTKPGIVLVPAGEEGDVLVEALGRRMEHASASILLNERIRASYLSAIDPDGERRLGVFATGPSDLPGNAVPARLWEVPADRLSAAYAEECFGPSAVIVRYAGRDDLWAALAQVPSSLTATIHHEPADVPDLGDLLAWFRDRAGRLVFNGYPTGVLVSWAQTHGGPWPATNSLHTSVGTTSIRRFLRPVTWQSADPALLPEELREEYTAIPRRIDGTLVVPPAVSAGG